MVDELEYAVDTLSGDDLERLLPGFLRERGYDSVKETSPIGKDSGVDAYVELGAEQGIAHASKRKDWRAKIREDAKKVKSLEDDGETVDFLAFLTNRDPDETQVRKMESEIENDYGWPLRLYHKTNLIGTLESQDPPKLADRHLGIDLSIDESYIRKVNSLVTSRVDAIKNRQGPASDLEDAPYAILHLIPSGAFTGDYIQSVNDLPDPPIYAMLGTGYSNDVTGQGKYETNHRGSVEYPSYTYLRKDGLFEAVGTERFIENSRTDGPSKWIRNDTGFASFLDREFIINAKAGLHAMREMGASGSVKAQITLLGVEGYHMTIQTNSPFDTAPSFTRDFYQTDLADGNVEDGKYDQDGNKITISSDDPVYSMMEPLITQYWQETGRKQGSPHFDDSGAWSYSDYTVNL